MKHETESANRRKKPIGENEDVEFSPELADEDDVEALQRVEAADCRQQADSDEE